MNKGFKLKTVSVRLVPDAPILSNVKLDSPQAVYDCVGDYLSTFDREVVCLVFQKADGIPICASVVSIGGLTEAMVYPRELFKAAFLSNAYSMIMVHNHPSGNLYPSKTDTVITDRIMYLGELVGIPLVDHIIVGGDNKKYFSFKEKELMENKVKLNLETDYKKLDFREVHVAEETHVR